MGVFKCNVGLVWSLVLAAIITVVPRYWELKIESIPPLVPLVSTAPLAVTAVAPQTEVVEDTIQRNTTLVATLVDYDVPAVLASRNPDHALGRESSRNV